MDELLTIFVDAYERAANGSVKASSRLPDAALQLAEAVHAAERTLFLHLRDRHGWGWLNAHRVAVRFGLAALEWSRDGRCDAVLLRERLRAEWEAQREIWREEVHQRRATQAVLGGLHVAASPTAGALGAFAGCGIPPGGTSHAALQSYPYDEELL